MRTRLFPLALAVAACGPPAVPPLPVTPGVDPCLIAARGESRADSATIAADGIVFPNYALPPVTAADHLVFSQAFETLVRVRCDGHLAPGLADRWTADSSGRSWTLTIRPDARFSNGNAVIANDVVLAWTERQSYSEQRGIRGPALESVTAIGEREIVVRFRDPQRDGPRLLADPHFAVHHRDPHVILPMGTGPYRPDPNPESTVLVPQPTSPAPVLVVRVTPAGDSRDLIDRGVDVLMTWDRRAVDYAATRPELAAKALPADRAYVLLAPGRSPALAASTATAEDARWTALRASLARDVVRGTAPAAGPWWATRDRLAACATDPGVPPIAANPPVTRTRRLVYPADDRLAGEIARRLVALAAYDRGAAAESAVLRELMPAPIDGGDEPVIAAGLSDVAISRALARGADAGYLVVLGRRPLDSCAAWRTLATRAPWVTVAASALVAEAGPTLITGPRAPAIVVDWDNTLRFFTGTVPPRDSR